MRIATIISIMFFLVGCEQPSPNGKRTLDTAKEEPKLNGKKIIDTGRFEIEVPANWKYYKERGIDSFVGCIKSDQVSLYFDWSEMGYANHLAPTVNEYIEEGQWQWMLAAPYLKEGVIYTNGDTIEERDRIMKEKGITDTAKVQVEKIQIPQKEIIYQEGQYKAILTYDDTIQQVNIAIPEEVKKYDFLIDTVNGYYRKIVYPKKEKDGMTGVYFQDLKSGFNFNLVGENLSLINQEEAVTAFKTIRIKRE